MKKSLAVSVCALLLILILPSCEESDIQKAAEIITQIKGKSEITVVLVGDSITGSEYSTSGASWGSLLKPKLAGFTGTRISLVNSARLDETYDRAIRHIEEDVFSYRPDVVFVMLGMSDLQSPRMVLPVFKDNVFNFYTVLRKQNIFVIALTPPGSRDLMPGDEEFARFHEYCDMISLQARLNHFPVINVAQALRTIQIDDQAAFESLFEDAVHLNAKGREKVVSIIIDSLSSIMEHAK